MTTLHATRDGLAWATTSRAVVTEDHSDDELPGAVVGTLDHLVETLERTGVPVPDALREITVARQASAAGVLLRRPPGLALLMADDMPYLAASWEFDGWTARVAVVQGSWVGCATNAGADRLATWSTPTGT